MKKIPLLALLFASGLHAADYHWTGAADSDWDNPANWLVGSDVPETPPANPSDERNGDNVIFSGDASAVNQPVLSENQRLCSLTFNSAGWTISSTNPPVITLSVAYIDNTGGLHVYADGGTNTIDTKFSFRAKDNPRDVMLSSGASTVRFNHSFGKKTQSGSIRFKGDALIEAHRGSGSGEGNWIATGSVFYNQVVLRIMDDFSATSSGKNVKLSFYDASVLELHSASYRFALYMDAGTELKNANAEPVSLAAVANGSTVDNKIAGKITGAINLTLGNADGGNRSMPFGNPGSDFTGKVQINNTLTVHLECSALAGQPGAFGNNPGLEVFLGASNGNGSGNTAPTPVELRTVVPCEIGHDIRVGSDNRNHRLGTVAEQEGTTVFSGDIAVGLGASSNKDNPHLYISAGSNACVNFTGNITNWVTRPTGGSWAVKNGGVFMEGPGTARLSGANTYKGGTFAQGGTLIAASEDAPGTGAVTVDGGTFLVSGTTLTNTVVISEAGGGIGGRGAIEQPLVITNGATLCPGDFTGALHVPSQTWERGGAYQWQVSTNGFDQLLCSGTLTVAATPGAPFTIAVSSINDLGQPAALHGFNPRETRSWPIATAGAITGFDASCFAIDTTLLAAHTTLHPKALFSLKTTGTTLWLTYLPPTSTLLIFR